MRLLYCNSGGGFNLTHNLTGADVIPPYAILSHTWKEGEEVTYDELIEGSGKNKAGYNKISFCAQQAKSDELEYFWVDTCCIKKTDEVELREAISSMFRWYQNATRCYVFLSDVAYGKRKADTELDEWSWAAAFQKSRWFTRGWTLQELLAPTSVEFFSKEWKRLGDKTSLQKHIYKATRIPHAALQGAPLLQFSINERMKWSEHRETKVPEDRAYCLIGVFGVQMTPFYGEGLGGAFARLMDEANTLNRCLQDLRLSDPHDDKKRIEDTKGGLLKDSYCWVLDNASFLQWRHDSESQLLWVKGDPGKGKTMLLCGIINELQRSVAKGALISYFFCQATDSHMNSAVAVLRGLLYLLLSQQPSLISYIRKKYDHAGRTMFEDANAWFVLTEIFANVLQDPSLNTAYLVIDALDECITDLPKLLDFVVKHSSTTSRIQWIVSSRNWPEIEERLERGQKVRLSLELNTESVSAAVGIFISRKVAQLAQNKMYDDKTQVAVLDHLVSNANGTFLWVALVCQSLEKTAKRHVLKKIASFPSGLDSLYERMMQQIRKSDDAEICRDILALIALVQRPVTVSELVALVKQLEDTVDNPEAIREIIDFCGSFLIVREETIYFVHQSAKEFLLTNAAEEVFPSGIEDFHHTIFVRSLDIMSRTLQRDMYGLKSWGYSIGDVEQPDLDPLAASRYSCIYWVDHLCDSNPNGSAKYGTDLEDEGAIDLFLRRKYLYWLEALSLCKSMSKGVVSMLKLQSLVQASTRDTSKVDALNKLIQDAYRFIMYHKGSIDDSPLQAYASALLFSPTASLVRDIFKDEEPNWVTIKPDMEATWSPCLQTIEGHSDTVNLVAFSPDSTQLASASDDGTIKVWDAGSGECLYTLDADGVTSIAFSPNSAWLASASWPCLVQIWDSSKRTRIQTLDGHIRTVRSVAFSHHSVWLASGSDDCVVKLWNTSNGEHLRTFEGHTNEVDSVAFSHDSALLVSASTNSHRVIIKLWDMKNGNCLHTIESHASATSPVAFSHDYSQLASVLSDSVLIWDASSGECLKTLKGHNNALNSIAFSHDSTLLVSASWDCTLKVWDVNSGDCLKTFDDHSMGVASVAFSHDSTRLASASFDHTVKVWDASISKCLPTLQGHSDAISSISLSPDLTLLASTSMDNMIKIWDVNSANCLQTLRDQPSGGRSLAFSPNSTWIVSGSAPNTVKIWDMSSGKCLQTFIGHEHLVSSVAFSYDSAWIASASYDGVKIWDANSGKCLWSLEGDYSGHAVGVIAFSPDSVWLASALSTYDDEIIKIWDTNSGECVETFRGHQSSVTSVAFSHNLAWLASASLDGIVKIWHLGSETCLKTLGIGRVLYNISFDSSDSYLHTDIGAIRICGLSNPSRIMANSGTETPQYEGLAISADGVWITYNSEKVVRLPSRYCPSRVVVSGNIIGIGTATGKVWIYNIQTSAQDTLKS